MAKLDVVPMGNFATVLPRRELAMVKPKFYRGKWPATKVKMWRTRTDDHVNMNSNISNLFAGNFIATMF